MFVAITGRWLFEKYLHMKDGYAAVVKLYHEPARTVRGIGS